MDIHFGEEDGEWIPIVICKMCGMPVPLKGDSMGHVLWPTEDRRSVTVHKGICHWQAEQMLKLSKQTPLWIPLAEVLVLLQQGWGRAE